jgi:hypothetical protein
MAAGLGFGLSEEGMNYGFSRAFVHVQRMQECFAEQRWMITRQTLPAWCVDQRRAGLGDAGGMRE